MKSLNQKLKRAKPLLGTFVEIELRAKTDVRQLSTWITAGFEAIEGIDRLMSVYRQGSDLYRLNQGEPGVWLNVHPHTINVLKASNELWFVSKGVFDVRCPHPSGRGMRTYLEFRGTAVRKSGPWTFDLGGIAKGYAVDCAVETIQQAAGGTRTEGIVNAGGDLRSWGGLSITVATIIHGKRSCWARPFKIQQIAAASSAVRRVGSRIPLLSPACYAQMPEGKPFRNARSITVLASQCLWADALTKVVLMGPKKIAAECLSRYRARALGFSSDGRLSEVLS